ncbi:MAG: 1-deoxy-D-xylulose-5-phosphate reductoisomerase [Elusimicrobiota bacterium]|jgi:1-deoxy-D-xylulose-5-phosphate reductoisomerase|nr:1-deoxy-D-xylulose-5-phosphate reductoisomerase [Elusimicrobiota bacterium]
MKKIVVLGSSGSIGIQALDVISKLKKDMAVVGLSVHSNIPLLKSQIKQFKPKAVSVNSPDEAKNLKEWLASNKLKTTVFYGKEGLEQLVSMKEADTVLAAIVGAACLAPLIKAIESGKTIALANKEVLIMAGYLITSLAKKHSVSILPVDSEHSAIFQCCIGENKSKIKKIILTASGGPFHKPNIDFSKITLKDALAHPTWKMGKKITIDSATLMNKGLEAIEACVLFDVDIDKIEIVIHPQSIIHSMVEYVDGSIIAQMSKPDMRIPIQYALTYPDRIVSNLSGFDLAKFAKLEFYKPQFNKFPCLKLALKAARSGGTFPAVMNAANETAVKAFLDEKISFVSIAKIISKTMSAHKNTAGKDVETIINADDWARKYADNLIRINGRTK